MAQRLYSASQHCPLLFAPHCFVLWPCESLSLSLSKVACPPSSPLSPPPAVLICVRSAHSAPGVKAWHDTDSDCCKSPESSRGASLAVGQHNTERSRRHGRWPLPGTADDAARRAATSGRNRNIQLYRTAKGEGERRRSTSLLNRLVLSQGSAWTERLRITSYSSLTLKITRFTPRDSVSVAGGRKLREVWQIGENSRLHPENPSRCLFVSPMRTWLTEDLIGWLQIGLAQACCHYKSRAD